MTDLLNTFKERAEQLVAAINDRGGIRTAIEGLRRQMAEADRRRAIQKVKAELRRLDLQITEMITAVGVQAVGLHKSGRLQSPELAPLCQHIVDLETAVAQQRAELTKLEAEAQAAAAQRAATQTVGAQPAGVSDLSACPTCGEALVPGGTFCAHCGAAVPQQQQAQYRFCPRCGAELRPGARFCAQCGYDLTAKASEAAAQGTKR